MPESSFGSAFSLVDRTGDPAALLEYLERTRALAPVLTSKRESFDLLEAKPGDRILDLGCGPGYDAYELARRVDPEGSVVGVDNSSLLIEAARSAVSAGQPGVEFVQAGAESLPFEAESFDACRSDRTIQHVEDPVGALAELFRVTKPAGVVVISETLTRLDPGGSEEGLVAAEILRHFWSQDERRAWAGYHLPLLIRRGGFAALDIHSSRGTLTSFADASLLLQLPAICQQAVSAGAVDAKAAVEWLRRLEEEFAYGRAELELQFTHFKARRP